MFDAIVDAVPVGADLFYFVSFHLMFFFNLLQYHITPNVYFRQYKNIAKVYFLVYDRFVIRKEVSINDYK